MTTMSNEQLERRISEHLDGRLNEADRTDLLRELMRDPAARRTHDAWAANDRAAAMALRSVVDMPARPFVIQPRKRRTIPWAQLAATAALLVMAVGVWAIIDQLNTIESVDQTRRSGVVGSATTANNTTARTEPTTAEPRTTVADTAASIMSEPTATESVDRWWRQPTSPIDNGKLVDTAAATRVVDRQTPQNARQINHRSLLGVIDKTTHRTWWLDVRSERTAIHAVGGEM